MSKTIVIDGIEYELNPVKKESILPVPEQTIINEYTPEVGSGTKSIKVATPKVSDYRERFKKHEVKPSELKPERKFHKLVNLDQGLDDFGDLIVGPGLQEEY